MLGRGFQIKWPEETIWLHSFSNYGIFMKKKQVPETPNIEIKSIKVPGSHRVLKQEKTYGTRPIIMECGIYTSSRADTKRLLMDLMYKLSREVILRFDDKPDIIYYAEMNQQLDVNEVMSMGSFTLSFICLDGFRYSIDKAGPLVMDSEMTMANDIFFGMHEETEFFNITQTQDLILNNAGTYDVYPVIEIEGTAAVIHIDCNDIRTSYGPVSAGETIYINSKEYEITKKVNNDITNALLNWQGDFIFLKPRLNEVKISGTNLNITRLKFDYRHTFL